MLGFKKVDATVVAFLHDGAKTASLHQFGHAIALAFEVNLAYSILTWFVDVIDKLFGAACHNIRTAALPLSEYYETFDVKSFSQKLLYIEGALKIVIGLTRYVVLVWAIFACITAVAFEGSIPFQTERQVSWEAACTWSLFLYGALPFGLVVIGAVYVLCRIALFVFNIEPYFLRRNMPRSTGSAIVDSLQDPSVL